MNESVVSRLLATNLSVSDAVLSRLVSLVGLQYTVAYINMSAVDGFSS